MKKITAVCLFSILSAVAARADIIFFKDGLKTICQERAWEEEDRVKCEYGGYVIVYDKSDVLRILQTSRPKSPPKTEKKPSVVKKSVPDQRDLQKASPAEVGRLVFYDPRRPQKYWTAENSKHKSYNEAIQALAKQYDRPPDWIKAHMGDTNDLVEIHRNLSKQQPASNPGPKSATAAPVKKQPKLEFYNPRRPSPYWTSASAKHKSFKAAIQAFARTYNRSPEWIRENMGQTNDLAEIHSNLRHRHSEESSQ